MSAQGWIRACGWAGLLASILVGTGEFLLHFTPDGGIQDQTSYLFFNEVSEARLSMRDITSPCCRPRFMFWAITFYRNNLSLPGANRQRPFSSSAPIPFMIGAVWIGQRYFLGETVHAIADGNCQIKSLLTAFSEHNEPLVNVLRIAMLVVSILWIKLILSGKTAVSEMAGYIQSRSSFLQVYAGLIFCRDHGRIISVPDRNERNAFYCLRPCAAHNPKQTY